MNIENEKNVIHYHENNIQNIINNINKLIENNKDVLKNVVQNDFYLTSIRIERSLVEKVKELLIEDAAKAKVFPPTFSEFIRMLLLAYVLSHIENKSEKMKKREEPRIKCFVCGEPAVCMLQHFRTRRTYPVCEQHKRECLEAGWTLVSGP